MKSLVFVVSAVLLLVLTACPVSSVYPLGEKGAVPIDNSFFGTWHTSTTDAEAKKLTISKGSEANTYRIHVDERGEMFTADGDDFIGWNAELDGMKFLVLQQEINGELKETYYVYAISKKDKQTIVSNDISLKVNGTDAITSIENYRKEVSASMKMDGFLASEQTWTKQ